MTDQEQEILDILSNKIYVIVEYDDSAANEYLRYAANLEINTVKIMLHLKVISERLTWNDAMCFHIGRNKCYIADYRNIKDPVIL